VKYETIFAWNNLSSSGFVLGRLHLLVGPTNRFNSLSLFHSRVSLFLVLESACELVFELEITLLNSGLAIFRLDHFQFDIIS
jgi:hypothetical protein